MTYFRKKSRIKKKYLKKNKNNNINYFFLKNNLYGLFLGYFYFFNEINFMDNIYIFKKQYLNYIYNNGLNKISLKKKNYFYYFFKKIFFKNLLSLTLLVVCILFLSSKKMFHFNKITFTWFLILYSNYLLYSGFVFFTKKYQFGKYVSAIQRYWRKTYMIFWMIEGFLFLIFIYLTLNSNQEPVFIYDNIQIYKKHFYSWRVFLLKSSLIVIFILINYYILISVKTLHNKKLILLLSINTVILTYLIWLEFYQFFYVLSYYWNVNWIFDSLDRFWFLENELKRTRMVNHYNNLLVIIKFWHLIFIYFFWIFFLFRYKEISRIRYSLFSTNLQNLIILYIMSWLIMYPWAKYIIHQFIETPYYWFFNNNLSYTTRLFLNNLINLIWELFYLNNLIDYNFNISSFFYWHANYIFSNIYDYKAFIKDWSLNNCMRFYK